MNLNHINHMEYLPDMEILQSDTLERVLSGVAAYDYNKYTAQDVERA